jgi:uncharacterized protein YgiM (DUF1202 family)
LWGFILLCLFAPSVLAQAKFPFTARVKAAHVNVRAGQSNNYESLAEVNKGDEIIVTGKNYSWYQVRLPEGSKMYVKMGYLKLLSTEVGEITADRVNIRARSNTSATIIGQLVRGDHFFIKENSGEWLWIRPLAKAQGWIHADFLEFKDQNVTAKSFQDPSDAAARARVEAASLERKRQAKFAALRMMADGTYEVEGTIVRSAESKGLAYKLMGRTENSSGDVCLAYIDAPASMLVDFTGSKVIVRGAAKDDASLSAVILSISKIKLSL